MKARITDDGLNLSCESDEDRVVLNCLFSSGRPHALLSYGMVHLTRQVPKKDDLVWVEEAEGGYQEKGYVATVVEIYATARGDEGCEMLVEPVKPCGTHKYYALRRCDKVTVLR